MLVLKKTFKNQWLIFGDIFLCEFVSDVIGLQRLSSKTWCYSELIDLQLLVVELFSFLFPAFYRVHSHLFDRPEVSHQFDNTHLSDTLSCFSEQDLEVSRSL